MKLQETPGLLLVEIPGHAGGVVKTYDSVNLPSLGKIVHCSWQTAPGV